MSLGGGPKGVTWFHFRSHHTVMKPVSQPSSQSSHPNKNQTTNHFSSNRTLILLKSKGKMLLLYAEAEALIISHFQDLMYGFDCELV